MLSEGVFVDVLLTLLCYAYTLLIILVSSKMDEIFHISQKASRKFLHVMIGNLVHNSIFHRVYLFSSSCCSIYIGNIFCVALHSVQEH